MYSLWILKCFVFCGGLGEVSKLEELNTSKKTRKKIKYKIREENEEKWNVDEDEAG